MLRKLNLLLFAVLCVVLLPAVASAGLSTGACWVYDAGQKGEFPALAACTEDFTEEDCNEVSVLVNFSPGATCAQMAGELQIEWNGSCLADFVPADEVCVQLWSAVGAEGAQGLCAQEINGSWFTDLECGGTPVPTVPPVGLAALAMLMLAAALVVLSLRGAQTAV